MIEITPTLFLDEAELQFTFIRSPGPGGQNVNKVATAVQLRFDVQHSPSLSEDVRERLIAQTQSKLTSQGELIIKATRHRTQERNKQDALERLVKLIHAATIRPKRRRKTKPTYTSIQRRLTSKKLHGKAKALRQHKPNRNEE